MSQWMALTVIWLYWAFSSSHFSPSADCSPSTQFIPDALLWLDDHYLLPLSLPIMFPSFKHNYFKSMCVCAHLSQQSSQQSETGGILHFSGPVDSKTNESRWQWSVTCLWSEHFTQTHPGTTPTPHSLKCAFSHKETLAALAPPSFSKSSHWVCCIDTRDGVWTVGSPLVASSITIFQRLAILSYIHLSWSFSLFCMCSLTPLSVKSTGWLCHRQQLDGFKLLAWTFSGWWLNCRQISTKNAFIVHVCEKHKAIDLPSGITPVTAFVDICCWLYVFEV